MNYDDSASPDKGTKEGQHRVDGRERRLSSLREREEEWRRHPPRAPAWEERASDDEEEPEWDGPDDRDAAEYWRYWGYEVDDDGEPIETEEERAAFREALRRVAGAKG